MANDRHTRRRFVQIATATTATVTLAGCGEPGDEEPAEETDEGVGVGEETELGEATDTEAGMDDGNATGGMEDGNETAGMEDGTDTTGVEDANETNDATNESDAGEQETTT